MERLSDDLLEVAGDHPAATRSIVHLLGHALWVIVAVLCGSGLLVRWL